jgi:hypothetical protein
MDGASATRWEIAASHHALSSQRANVDAASRDQTGPARGRALGDAARASAWLGRSRVSRDFAARGVEVIRQPFFVRSFSLLSTLAAITALAGCTDGSRPAGPRAYQPATLDGGPPGALSDAGRRCDRSRLRGGRDHRRERSRVPAGAERERELRPRGRRRGRRRLRGAVHSDVLRSLPSASALSGPGGAMGAAQSTGDCNSCHTVEGTNGAPGRILLP